MCHIYTVEYYSAMREDEILPFVTAWMDLENIMLNKSVSKIEEPYDITSTWDIKLKLIDTDKSIVITRGKGLDR